MALSKKAIETLSKKHQIPADQIELRLEKEIKGEYAGGDLLFVPFRMGTTLLRSMNHASRFFRELRDNGVFYAGKCPACGHTVFPPQRAVCQRCIKQGKLVEYEYMELGTEITGVCVSWSKLVRGTSKQGDLLQSYPSFVKVDGCDNAHWQIVFPGEAEEIQIGAKVKSVLRPAEERTGEITDFWFVLV